jgi:hypothetical protein
MNNTNQTAADGSSPNWLPGFLEMEAPIKSDLSRRRKPELKSAPADLTEKVIGSDRFHLGDPLRFDQLFSFPRAIERHVNAPFLDERLRFLRHLASQGSSKVTLRIKAYKLMTIVEYLPLERKGAIGKSEIKKAIERWAGRQPQLAGVLESIHAERNSWLSLAIVWLGFLGRLRQPAVARGLHTQMVEEFLKSMSEEQGLSPATIEIRRQHVTQFLARFGQNHRPFRNISILDIDAAIARKGDEDAYSRSSLKIYTGSLRAFLRFAAERAWCPPGLAEAIVSPRIFADEQLPQGPSWEEVERLLASTEGSEPGDILDRAVMLLLSIYGLRASEITNLKLGGHRLGERVTPCDLHKVAQYANLSPPARGG